LFLHFVVLFCFEKNNNKIFYVLWNKEQQNADNDKSLPLGLCLMSLSVKFLFFFLVRKKKKMEASLKTLVLIPTIGLVLVAI